MKKFKILWELSKHATDMKWANAVGKVAPIYLIDSGLPQTFNLLKTNKQIKKKTTEYYLWSTVKQNAVKWGVPVPDLDHWGGSTHQ